MINEQAVAYLQESKGKFPVETLKKRLAQAGYPDAVIDEAVAYVFLVQPSAPSAFGNTAGQPLTTPQASSVKPRLFDFRTPRTYPEFPEKFIDFLFGFFGIFLAYRLLGVAIEVFLDVFTYGYGAHPFMMMALPQIGLFIAHVWATIRFWKLRRFFALGLLAAFAVSFLFGGAGAGYMFWWIRNGYWY